MNFFGPLNLWERILLIVAASLAVLGLILLCSLYYEAAKTFGGDYYLFSDHIGAIGQVMSGLSGTLLSFAGSILFFVALMVQLREHRQSIKELENTTANHAQALSIAKEEKEFNVVSLAIEEIVNHINDIKYYDRVVINGHHAIQSTINAWKEHLTALTPSSTTFTNPYWEMLQSDNPTAIMPGYGTIHELLSKIRWLHQAVRLKPLDPDDRSYLKARIDPIISNTWNSVDGLADLYEHINRQIAEIDESHQLMPVKHGLVVCRNAILELQKL